MIVEHFIGREDLETLRLEFGIGHPWLLLLEETCKEPSYDPMEGPDAIQE